MEEENGLFHVELDTDDLEGAGSTPSDNGVNPATTPGENPDNTTPAPKVVSHTDDDIEGLEDTTPAKTTTTPPVARTDEELAAEEGVSVEIIQQAKAMGWSGRDNWKGNPKDYKGAAEFVRIAEESPKVMRERNLAMAKELADIKRMMPQILEIQKREYITRNEQLEREKKQLEEELKNAKLLADAEKASELTERLVETKMKQALNLQDAKDFMAREKEGAGDGVVRPDGVDLDKELAFRDAMWPKMTLRQREKWIDAVKVLEMPQNADQTTEQRIAYMKEKVFDIAPSTAPAASPVGRPSGMGTFEPVATNESPTSVWDSMSKEDKAAALDLIENVPWMKNRASDPETYKREFDKFKRGFQKYKDKE